MTPLNPSGTFVSRQVDFPVCEELSTWFEAEIHPLERGLKTWLRRRFPWLTDIDDLVQETYAKILQAKRQGRVSHARSYLFSMARNAAYDQARRKNVVVIESMAHLADLEVFDDQPSVADTLVREQELELLAAAIESLPERCRIVVKLRKLRGWSYEQIAQELGISVCTVNAHLAKGMALCRGYFRHRGMPES